MNRDSRCCLELAGSSRVRVLLCALGVVFTTTGSLAQVRDGNKSTAGLQFDLKQTVDDEAGSESGNKQRLAFGRQGAQRLTLTSGVADNFDMAKDYQVLGVAYSRFLTDEVELQVEGAGWYFDQEGDDAEGLSITVRARWHVLNRQRWSLFVDGGLGLLGVTDNVPEGGTGFNFMPQLGGGGSVQLGDSDLRAILGVRWHHISNGRIHGDVSNPSRDAPMFYVGLSFPL